MNNTDSASAKEPLIERRHILEKAIWGVPVVALAVAAPKAAASDVCELKTYEFIADPNNPNDRADIIVVTGKWLIVTYVKGYNSATEIKSDEVRFWKSPDSGVIPGFQQVIDLSKYGICDPNWLQVDGNNTHYYGGGVFR